MARPISEFVANFDRLPLAFKMDDLKDAALDATEVIRIDAAVRAPDDTGRLALGMSKKFKSDSTHASIEVDIGPGKKQFYGRFQDKGTKFQPAQPFLDPAMRAQGPIAAFLLGESIKRLILKVMKT